MGDDLVVRGDGDELLGTVTLEQRRTHLAALGASARPGAEAAVLDALLAHAAQWPRRRLDVIVSAVDGPDADAAAPDSDALLRAAGLTVVLDQLHVHGPLAAPARRSPAFRYRPAGAGTRRTLLWLLTRIWDGGRDTPVGRTPADELREIEQASAGADGLPDRRLWRIAVHDGCPAGVILAHRDPATPHVGGLAAFGLVPELRGRGLGAALHRDALALLSAAGVTEYQDSVARANAPMRALLERAGGTPRGATRVYAQA